MVSIMQLFNQECQILGITPPAFLKSKKLGTEEGVLKTGRGRTNDKRKRKMMTYSLKEMGIDSSVVFCSLW